MPTLFSVFAPVVASIGLCVVHAVLARSLDDFELGFDVRRLAPSMPLTFAQVQQKIAAGRVADMAE
jgi:hypothetical protein